MKNPLRIEAYHDDLEETFPSRLQPEEDGGRPEEEGRRTSEVGGRPEGGQKWEGSVRITDVSIPFTSLLALVLKGIVALGLAGAIVYAGWLLLGAGIIASL